MQIEYDVVADDLYQLSQLMFTRTAKNNWPYMVQRITISAVVAIFAAVFIRSSLGNLPAYDLHFLVFALLLFILTLIVYPWISRRDVTHAVTKALKAGNCGLGHHRVEITPETYTHVLADVETRIKWGAVQNIEVLGPYILISLAAQVMDIIPCRAFASSSDCDAFVRTLTAYSRQARGAAAFS